MIKPNEQNENRSHLLVFERPRKSCDAVSFMSNISRTEIYDFLRTILVAITVLDKECEIFNYVE